MRARRAHGNHRGQIARAGVLSALAALPLLAGSSCAPDVRIVESAVAVYDLSSPGQPIQTGDQIGIRIPVENVGTAGAGSVAVVAQLLDRNGAVLQQRSTTIQTLQVGSTPVFDFRPFETDAPDLLDAGLDGTFRISLSVGGTSPDVHDHVFPVLPALAPDIGVLEGWAAQFVPFQSFRLDNCFATSTAATELVAAVELYALDPANPLAVSPADAEPQVVHMADTLRAQYYDPDAPNTWGPCRLTDPLPDPPTGLAELAYLLKVYGADWGRDTREAIRRTIELPDWRYSGYTKVYNKGVPFPPMHLLFGEASCHAPTWQLGWNELRGMFVDHLQHGGFEANDRHYTAYHLGNLGLLGFLDTAVPRDMGRALFDLKSLLSAHLYLPGGHIGTLNTRLSGYPYYFPAHQRERSMGPMLAALAVGDDFQFANVSSPPNSITMLGTLLNLRRPLAPAIRRLFLAKGQGYEAWWLESSSKSAQRYPGTISNLGENGARGFAWQIDVLPGGAAEIGSSYGAWSPYTGNREGVAVRCPSCEQGFAFVYQWQVCVAGDTDDAGDPTCSVTEPSARQEGYDVERMQVYRSRISLFDPRSRTSRWPATPDLPVPRTYELTQTWLTNWDHPVVGGEKIFPTPGGWYVGRVGDVFIAYRPLGDDIQVSQMDGERLDGATNVDYATFFEMQGRSGGMTVLADPSEFPGDTLQDFAAEMDSRYWSFTAAGPHDGPVAEMDYRGADGRLCRMKLEYMGVGGLPGGERRFIDCSTALGLHYQEQTEAGYFAPLYGGQLMTSPWVSYDTAADVLHVTVPGYPSLDYDWGALRDAPMPTPVGCSDRAYLELGEPPDVHLDTTASAAVPSFALTIENTGFADTTVWLSFEGDDCTADTRVPNAKWLIASGGFTVPAGKSVVLPISGASAPCSPGAFAGVVNVTSLDHRALDAHLPVSLSVAP